MTKAAYKRKHVVGHMLQFQVLPSMSGSIAADRHGAGAAVESFPVRQKESKLGMTGALETSEPAPVTPPPPTRPCLKPFPNRPPPTGDQTYEPMGAILIKALHGTYSSTLIHTVHLFFSFF